MDQPNNDEDLISYRTLTYIAIFFSLLSGFITSLSIFVIDVPYFCVFDICTLIITFGSYIMHPAYRWKSLVVECLISFVLGFSGVFGYYLFKTHFMQFGIFLSSLSLYHMAEYLFVCSFHYKIISYNSFLINQSIYYMAATALGCLEYFVEYFFFTNKKEITCLIILGLCGMIIGQVFRIGALFSGGKSFHHIVQKERSPDHVLMTTGLYSFCRHPGYLGWYLWAVSSQLLMVNPICLILYPIACHQFFSPRIAYEEDLLIKMFKLDYVNYMKRVPTRIPFIPGLDITINNIDSFKLRSHTK